MLARTSAAALNHLLTQSGWALPRLARFAGKTVQVDIAPFSFAYTVREDGLVRCADAETTADARCVIAPSLLPRLALSDESAQAEIYAEGDAEFLKEIAFVSRHVRWDAAEDLSNLTGDIAAERIVQAVHIKEQQLRNAVESLSRSAAEYWTEEQPLLAKPRHVSAFIQDVDTLRDDVARLGQRIERLLAAHRS